MTEVIVWKGWIGGIGVGGYALFQVLLTGKLLGVSTGYGNLCSYVTQHPFFHKGVYADPANWRLWFLIGLPLGGVLAALTSPGEIHLSFSVGEMYDSVLPQALWAKMLVLGFGGSLIGYGARMAGGCLSGHTIMGGSLLSPPSMLASIGFFVGGIISVQFLFNVIN